MIKGGAGWDNSNRIAGEECASFAKKIFTSESKNDIMMIS